MIPPVAASEPRPKLLVIAPHPDDEILGVGGTIAKLARQGYEVTVLTVSGHLPPLYPAEAYEKTLREAKAAHALVGVTKSVFLGVPATMLGDAPVAELNGKIVDVVREVGPSIVLCPYPDRHVDHRYVFESTMVATRPVGHGRGIRVVAAYETLSETHWNAPHIEPNFTPNWVVDITDVLETKLSALRCYESQISPFPGPRSIEAVRALSVFRGTQAGFAHGEGLHVVRMVS
jgi:LmbE family N-acetylglucosaminyl deacetylase